MNKKNKTGVIFIATFILPFLLAIIVLKMGWFNAGITNKGEFLENEYSVLKAEKGNTWLLVYMLPDNCDAQCEQALMAMRQGILSLGKKQEKLVATTYYQRDEQKEMLTKVLGPLSDYTMNNLNEIDKASQESLSKNYLYLADPFGKVVLRYKLTKNHPEMITITKNILSDVKRLLKYSRTG